MYQEVHTENIAYRARAAEVREILFRYSSHALIQAGVSHEAFCADVMPDFGHDLTVLVREDDDYTHIHFGREVAQHMGGSQLGQRVSALHPKIARFTASCCDTARDSGRPVYSVHRALMSAHVFLWERLILPTIASDGRHHLIIFSRPLQFQEDLLNALLQTSNSGIVALRAVRGADGAIERAIVITANQQASILAGRPGEDLHDSELMASLPFLGEAAIWQRCLCAIELRRSDVIETSFSQDGRLVWLQIAITPLGDGLALTMTDISELMVANQTLQSRAATLALEIGRERATRRALSEEIGQREEREQELRRLAETDPLTTLLNRRSFVEKANRAIAACDERGEDTSLIIVDLDHFKSVNDTNGHAAGDAVIRAFADLLLGVVRSQRDLVGRFGGEEFAVFLPQAGTAAAQRVAERIQGALSTRAMPVSETLALQVTASFGIATRQQGESFTAFIERADRALYRAKNDGRDCIRLADTDLAAAA